MTYEIRLSRTRSKSGKHWRYYATKGTENHNEIHSFSPDSLEDYIATLPEDTKLVNNGVGFWKFRKLKGLVGTNETIDECVDGLHCGEDDKSEQGVLFRYDEYDPVTYAGTNFVEHVADMYRTGDCSQVITDFKLLREADWQLTYMKGFVDGIEKYIRELEGDNG